MFSLNTLCVTINTIHLFRNDIFNFLTFHYKIVLILAIIIVHKITIERS